MDNTTIKTDVHNLTGNASNTGRLVGQLCQLRRAKLHGQQHDLRLRRAGHHERNTRGRQHLVLGQPPPTTSPTAPPSRPASRPTSTPPPDITDFAAIKDTARRRPELDRQAPGLQRRQVPGVRQPAGGHRKRPRDRDRGRPQPHRQRRRHGGGADHPPAAPAPIPNNTGKTYSYRSAQLTASSSLVNAASLSYSVVAADNAVNSSTAASANVTVDNTQPVTPTSGAIATTNAAAHPAPARPRPTTRSASSSPSSTWIPSSSSPAGTA